MIDNEKHYDNFFQYLVDKQYPEEEFNKFTKKFGHYGLCFRTDAYSPKKKRGKMYSMDPENYDIYLAAIKESLVQNKDLLFDLVKDKKKYLIQTFSINPSRLLGNRIPHKYTDCLYGWRTSAV